MSMRLLDIYHRLPSPLRSAVASVRGWQLHKLRYGPETDRMVEETLERDTWSPRKWERWQQERLQFILHRAATKVPFYRNFWAERRRNGDKRSWELLENWPILDKDLLRKNPHAFLAEGCDPAPMIHEHTSGTTGTSIELWFSRDTVRRFYAMVEARWRRWYGVSRHDRWAILGGQLVAPVSQKQPPFWTWNQGMNQLYMSSYHLAPDLVPHYWQALKDYRVTYIWGYTSALFALAQAALKSRLRDLEPVAVITNAEPLFDYQREIISEAFRCPVRETYGMCEIVAAASECESGQLHQWPESGIVEILDDNQPVARGCPGEVVATGFLNPDMPLIRYRVGDRAVKAQAASNCPCGRTLPIFDYIEGRMDDVLITADGRRIGRLDPVFKSDLPIREAQIEQTGLRRVKVRYVPDDGFDSRTVDHIVSRLRERLGDVEVALKKMDAIPRGPNGKFRAVICNLHPEEKQQISRNNHQDSRYSATSQ